MYEHHPFELHTPHTPTGDQPTAIKQLVEGLDAGLSFQTLLGVTGSGKTYTMANVIAAANRPALIITPNKTLCAQMYSEMKAFFPNACVEYFVSYFDYFQPEAYIPSQDKYIDKDSLINEHLAALRLSASKSILTRTDTIIIATVSTIYGLGEKYEFSSHAVVFETGVRHPIDDVMKKLVTAQYAPSISSILSPGTFKRTGDSLTVYPAEAENYAVRISFFDDEVETVDRIDSITGAKLEKLDRYVLFPASHHVIGKEKLTTALEQIRSELDSRIEWYKANGKVVEAMRLKERVMFDLEMMVNTGTCRGIENYSRHLTGRKLGEPPPTLIDYLPKDSIVFIDESHTTVPQIGGMSHGDRSRKETLVNYGFRLPSALDARPLRWEEFLERIPQTVFVSATPGQFELEVSGDDLALQIVRPTGVVDPVIEVRDVCTQVDDIVAEVKKRAALNERTLITVLTKKMAEDLAEFFHDNGMRARYLHGEVDAVERVEILRDLRLGKFDVLVGVNLLREGLDLPEVSLVAVFDADKEGFLRNQRSLIQTVGRAARNINGFVIFYADKITKSMEAAIDETNHRRHRQIAYNIEHGITPRSTTNQIRAMLDEDDTDHSLNILEEIDQSNIPNRIRELEREMKAAAKDLKFEHAAKCRDKIFEIRRRSIGHI